MNKTELNKIEMKARREAENSFNITGIENKKGHIISYGISLDGRLYWSLEDIYERYSILRPKLRRASRKEIQA